MAHRLRPVGLDLVGMAPVRHVFTRRIPVRPAAVHGAPVDVPGWADWFPRVKAARALDGGAGRSGTP
ncbi:hypothetical protein ABTZ58_24815 [Streptomyces sp. NPDC094143]|uniref:hypothetical protein n=1 Tax=Streptomyces sp. NPDC094143 TaxID=3155310 RepID=UPI0033225DF5